MSTSASGTATTPGTAMAYQGPAGAPTSASGAFNPMYSTAPGSAPAAPSTGYTSGNYTTDAYGAAAQDMTNASAGATAAMGYQPQQVGYQPVTSTATVKPQSFTDVNMNAYMNPYQDQVIAGAQSDLYNANQMALNDVGYGATQAGAFGGSRHGVAEGTTNQAYIDANSQMLADLYYQGYDQASNLAMQDIGNNMQGQMFNAGAMNTTNQFNASNGLNAQLANQQAGLAGANLNLSGSQALTGTANTGFGQANTLANQQAYYGAQQQAANQAVLDQQNAMWNAYYMQPGTSLGYNTAAVGTVGQYAPKSATQTQDPGLLGWTGALMSPFGF